MVDFINGNSSCQRLCNAENPAVVLNRKQRFEFFVAERCVLTADKSGVFIFNGGNRFFERAFKSSADCHNFACSFHFGAEEPVTLVEFIKRPFRDFGYNVIQRRLKRSNCFLRN